MAVSLSRLLMGTLPAATLLAASPCWAQTQAQVPATSLDPVTVTATKTPHQVDDVPASVKVIGPEEIERRVPRSVNDILGDVPGVEMTGGPRRNALDVNIRGFEGQRVVTTVDGARQNFDAGHKGRFFIDPDLLKQVEVLKGPASTLYGSGALGGVVALRTKDASDFLEAGEVGAVRGKYGYSSVRREPFYSVTGASRPEPGIDILGSFAYRNSGSMRQGGDRELADSREQLHSGLLKMGFDHGNGHKLFGSFNMANEHGNVPSNASSTFNGVDIHRMDRHTERTTGTFGYSFESPDSPLVAPTVTVYRNQIYSRENRLNSTTRLDETNLATTGFDLRNTSKLGELGLGEHTLTYGTEYYADSQQGIRNGAARPGYPGANNFVTGLYVQDEIVLGAFSIIPGARFDNYKMHSDASTIENDESRLSPRLGAVWRTTPWLNLFASYAEAFRAPSLTEMYISGTHNPPNNFINNPNLKPETVQTYEGGARLKFNDVLSERDSLRFRTSAFYTKAKDYIDLFILSATEAQYQNISKAKLDGFEAETLYDTPHAFGSLGFAKVTGENRSTSTARSLNSLQGDKFTATAGRKLPEWDLLVGARSQVVLEQNNTDPTMFDNVQRTGGYAVHGIFASWQPSSERLRGLRLDGGIDNIADKAYRRHQSTLYQEGRDVYGAVSYTMKF